MPGNPRPMVTVADRRFPVRIRIAVPPGGLGQRYTQITAWPDENCGAQGWAMTPSGTRGVLNDALSIYFADATLASAFVARWCLGTKAETAGGVFLANQVLIFSGVEGVGYSHDRALASPEVGGGSCGPGLALSLSMLSAPIRGCPCRRFAVSKPPRRWLSV